MLAVLCFFPCLTQGTFLCEDFFIPNVLIAEGFLKTLAFAALGAWPWNGLLHVNLGFVVSRAPPSHTRSRRNPEAQDGLAEAETCSCLMGICSTLGFFRCGLSNSMVTRLALERRRLKTRGSFLMKALCCGNLDVNGGLAFRSWRCEQGPASNLYWHWR